jgi:hypothetical protein
MEPAEPLTFAMAFLSRRSAGEWDSRARRPADSQTPRNGSTRGGGVNLMTVTATQDLEPPSALLRALASDPRDELRVTDILAYLGDRALAGAMLVFALPILAPLPPGSNFVLGIPLLAITGQLMLGRSTLWLPDMIGRRQVRLESFRSFLHKAADRLEWFEKHMKPRHGMFCTPRADRLVGGACFVLALLLFLPLPSQAFCRRLR